MAKYTVVTMPGDGIGIGALMERVRTKFPRLRYGYFNPPLRGSRSYTKKSAPAP